jgi:hypothetical protein
VGGEGWGWGKEGEMTQTLYAHMNKRNLKKEKIFKCGIFIQWHTHNMDEFQK